MNNSYSLTSSQINHPFAGAQQPSGGVPQPADLLQMISQENCVKANGLNEGLAALRGKLFGEAEGPSKDIASANMPMPSIQGSLSLTNESLANAIRQLESILSRL